MSEQKQDVAATEEQQPVLQIQRIYVKDVSFEPKSKLGSYSGYVIFL